MLEPEIKLVEWGVANNFGDFIEIHKDLPNYPSLYLPIIEHERNHSSQALSLYDFVHDLRRTKGLSWIGLWGFMIRRPKTWVQVLPLYYRKDKGFIFDLNLTIIYLISLVMIFVLTLLI